MRSFLQIIKQSLKVSQDVNLIEDYSSYNQLNKPQEALQPPMTGYTEAKSLLLEMLDKGYEDLDILVALNERFDRQLADTVLEDCRRKGIF